MWVSAEIVVSVWLFN